MAASKGGAAGLPLVVGVEGGQVELGTRSIRKKTRSSSESFREL